MKYKNKKTGFVIDTTSQLLGDWVLYDPAPAKTIESVEELIEPTLPADSKTVEEQTGNADFDSITKIQIMQELDAFGIEYDKRANKQTLYDLMMQQGK